MALMLIYKAASTLQVLLTKLTLKQYPNKYESVKCFLIQLLF